MRGMADTRIEKDTLGEVRVPANALYGAQTQRAVENYPISGLREHPVFIRAFILLKKAAALANRDLETLEPRLADAIVRACDEILTDEWRYRDQFVVDVFQAGAGTSFNMNCNEVIANIANGYLGGQVGEYKPIHPNDHVNMAQSTNDVFPTAIRVSTLMLLRDFWPAIDLLADTFDERGDAFVDVIKSGRTHLQDAVPITMGQEFKAYAAAVRRAARLLRDSAGELRILGIGGTAAGPQTGLAEIILPTVQPGSSIMPGKVNPSMLECMNQVLFHIIGADTAVALAVQAGQLELNVMMPLMAFEILFSIEILKNFLPVFVEKGIRGIEADRKRSEAYYISSPALATALNPIIGYTRAAEIAKESAKSGKPIPQLLREKKLVSEEEIARIFTPEFLAGQADRPAPGERRAASG